MLCYPALWQTSGKEPRCVCRLCHHEPLGWWPCKLPILFQGTEARKESLDWPPWQHIVEGVTSNLKIPQVSLEKSTPAQSWKVKTVEVKGREEGCRGFSEWSACFVNMNLALGPRQNIKTRCGGRQTPVTLALGEQKLAYSRVSLVSQPNWSASFRFSERACLKN